MKVLVLPIGRMRSRPLSEIAADYAGRISHYCGFHTLACRDDGEALSNIEGADFVVLMDAAGSEKDSEGLARFLSHHMMRATKRLVFFIGGPDGAGKEIRGRANLSLSLSRMTFPHELAQTMLLEQIYRAFSIIKGEPYHK